MNNEWINTNELLPKLYTYVEITYDGLISNGEAEYTDQAEVAGWYGHFEIGFANRSGYLIPEPKFWRYKN